MNFTPTETRLAGPTIAPNIRYLSDVVQPPTLEALAAPFDPDNLRLPIDKNFALGTLISRVAQIYGHEPGQEYALFNFWSIRHLTETLEETLTLDEAIKAADEAAYQEVKKLPGFIVYSANGPNANGESDSWCLWQSWEEAEAAHSLPAHRSAARRIHEFYRDSGFGFHNVRWLGNAGLRPQRGSPPLIKIEQTPHPPRSSRLPHHHSHAA